MISIITFSLAASIDTNFFPVMVRFSQMCVAKNVIGTMDSAVGLWFLQERLSSVQAECTAANQEQQRVAASLEALGAALEMDLSHLLQPPPSEEESPSVSSHAHAPPRKPSSKARGKDSAKPAPRKSRDHRQGEPSRVPEVRAEAAGLVAGPGAASGLAEVRRMKEEFAALQGEMRAAEAALGLERGGKVAHALSQARRREGGGARSYRKR